MSVLANSNATGSRALTVAVTPNTAIHRTSGKLRLPASGDFQR